MDSKPQHVLYSCGFPATTRTSWMSTNPGRRFYCCTINAGGCGFVGWRDPPMCSKSVDIIMGLLRKNNMHEEAARRNVDLFVFFIK
ncbi:hypothetical protein R6Q59_006463 [Mikania micrantha]